MMADPLLHLGVGVYAAEDGNTVPSMSSLPQTPSHGTVFPPVTSAQVQPHVDFICFCLLADSYSDMLISQPIMTALTSGICNSLTSTKQAL